jgi:hypothetical protein
MSADQIAQISPKVREVFEAPSDTMCATFEIAGNADAWVQVMKDNINAAYPFDNAPEGRVKEILASLPGSSITAWEAKTFVTLAFESTNANAVAKAVDLLFAKLFSAGNYSVTCRMEDL